MREEGNSEYNMIGNERAAFYALHTFSKTSGKNKDSIA